MAVDGDGNGQDAVTLASDGGSRSCGGCTACCEGWLADESMKLFVGSGCKHITTEGCGIYETRPEKPCRSFKCAWLTEPDQFPDFMRPDISGVIPVTNRDWYDWKVVRAFPCGAEVPADTLAWLIEYAKPLQLPVIFYEHHMDENGRHRGISEKAMGPVSFTDEVKRRPSDADVFRSLVIRKTSAS